jgi:hypothetical protein
MPRARARAQAKSAAFPLFYLPVETRLQIYGLLLPSDFCRGDKGRAFDEPDDAVDNDVINNDAIDDDAASEEPSTTYDDRQAYGQLLLVCKMIHVEAAPVFYNRVTFFVKESFKFANTFLRLLPAYKIASIRHLELKLSSRDFRYVNWKCRSKVLNDLITIFRVYRELSDLDSLTLTMHGCLLGECNQQEYMNCMRKAGEALAYTVAVAEFDVLEHVEDVGKKDAAIWYPYPRNVVARVKVQRRNKRVLGGRPVVFCQ